ncbi:zinc ribbon domain-containing protein [Kribbella albertanoniae]|uniref:Zinc ribbon domain-containing protein n=1 Tax=Kribbella albertanoniae TaxID=1266829 RepID=A0A4R4QFN6_9ACTN|nr:zinc ribbon domain-containing protein [Kribbella albertanoniae]TDC34290.1 zinc ribbon domain-containing protein [Kribbella albertanoniae]
MILCSDCGEQNEDGTVFCGRCGVFLEWEGEKVEQPGAVPTPVVVQPQEAVTQVPVVAQPAAAAVATVPAQEITGSQKPVPLPAPEQVARQPEGQQPGSRQPQTVKRKMPRRSKSPVIIPTGSRICGGCGMPNEGTRRFCAKCGFSLVDAKVIRKAAWWRRFLGRERVYAAGTRFRPSNARRRFRGATRIGVVLALLAGGGILAFPQRPLVMRAVHAVQDMVTDPQPVHLTKIKGSGAVGKQAPALAFDGAKNTYWGAPKVGKNAVVGPYVAGTFQQPVRLTHFGIYAGVSDQTPKFVAGPRPAELEITVFTEDKPVIKRFRLADSSKYQKFKLKVDDARGVQIAVVRSTNPSRATLTAIAEIELFGKP